LVVGFDILRSYWPLEVSFPIFWGNLLESWSRQARGTAKPIWATGSTIAVVPPRDATEAIITKPRAGRSTVTMDGQSATYLTETTAEGIYTVDFGGTVQRVAVGLMSELESRIAPLNAIEVGGRTIQSDRRNVEGRQELWPWLVLIALTVLSVEWLVYCRRSFM
jgi:hypothetical protein